MLTVRVKDGIESYREINVMNHLFVNAIMFHLHKQMSSEMKCFPFAYIYQCFLKLQRTGDAAREGRMTGNILKSTFLWHWALDLCSIGRATIAFWWGTCVIIIITNDDSWIVFQRSVMHKDYIVIGEGRTLPLPTQLECTHFLKHLQ